MVGESYIDLFLYDWLRLVWLYKGYALLLSAKYAVIASQEGIWITASKVGYMSFVNEYTWNELSDNDNMYQIKSIIGKNK